MTAADLVIQDLADGEAAALERIADLEQENAVLREMVREGLAQLARATAHLDAARHAIHALRTAEHRAVSPLSSAA